MNKTNINTSRAFIANIDPTEVLYPCVRPLHNPTPAVSAQTAPVLMSGSLVVASGRENRFNSLGCQGLPQRIAVVATVGDKPFRFSANKLAGFQSRQEELHFRRRRRVHVKSDRSTRAINQYHKLCSLAALGLSNKVAPFLALMKVPSTKHSFQRIWSSSSSCFRKLRQRFSSVPSSAHSVNRRCAVLFEPYSAGSALQGEPVHNIQRIASKLFRSSTLRRPRRLNRRHGFLRSGKWTLTLSHCSSVNRFQLILASRGIPRETILSRTIDFNRAFDNYFQRLILG